MEPHGKLPENFLIEEPEKIGAFDKILKILDKMVQLPNDFDRYFSGLQRQHGQSLLHYTTEHDHLYNKLSEHDVTVQGMAPTPTGWTDPRTTPTGHCSGCGEGCSQDPSPTAADSYVDETYEDFDNDAA